MQLYYAQKKPDSEATYVLSDTVPCMRCVEKQNCRPENNSGHREWRGKGVTGKGHVGIWGGGTVLYLIVVTQLHPFARTHRTVH